MTHFFLIPFLGVVLHCCSSSILSILCSLSLIRRQTHIHITQRSAHSLLDLRNASFNIASRLRLTTLRDSPRVLLVCERVKDGVRIPVEERHHHHQDHVRNRQEVKCFQSVQDAAYPVLVIRCLLSHSFLAVSSRLV